MELKYETLYQYVIGRIKISLYPCCNAMYIKPRTSKSDCTFFLSKNLFEKGRYNFQPRPQGFGNEVGLVPNEGSSIFHIT